MRNLCLLLNALTIAIPVACNDDTDTLINLRVDHYKQSAVGLGPTMVLQIQARDNIGSNEWEYFYSGIEGFEYEWGYTYDLRVKKETIDNPPADGPSIRYALEEIIARNEVGDMATFEVTLKSMQIGITPGVVVGDLTSGFELLDQTAIDCGDLCEEMVEMLQNEEELTGSFTHIGSGIRLVALKP